MYSFGKLFGTRQKLFKIVHKIHKITPAVIECVTKTIIAVSPYNQALNNINIMIITCSPTLVHNVLNLVFSLVQTDFFPVYFQRRSR